VVIDLKLTANSGFAKQDQNFGIKPPKAAL
jgi:hypothetical protein